MSGDNSRRRRKKFTFKTIENDKSYNELKELPVIPSHRQLLEGSIFDAVGPNFKQLKEDISSLYSVIERDVSNENRQIGLVELQLKKSLKRVNHAYNEVAVERDQNRAASYNSRLLGNFFDKEDNVQNSVNEIDVLVSGILSNIVQIDNKFPKKSQMLKEDLVNKQHYPLLFQLLNEKFPKVSSPLSTPSIPLPPQSIPSQNSLERSSPKESSHDETETATPPQNKIKTQFMPPTLRRKICAPSTSTTLENINASEIINIKRSE
ncbi:hypothetical protein ZYGR_0N03930 [Zygosaccharomyces rouxii]|uniref:ZYRO0D09306p n=2 Tax=Zygosaccharomyces rouxii TaxID=4956 RepID=C5DVT7_ZYGRC|nr:uncharacterized protein ZYRO0D09306g [Zygosaccharomyces rouxii]KAH9200817.1 hypothetical protein LQ764DRAFT_99367 [Zygosaccharomyces rouxii]GAV48988.1 hypothetical protein ZYGR_0N03930 [Zygosaccharomyces rouxii]CAR27906.1 ZYRO0D09306p [Zygosaccharomyces rouxii]